MMDRWPSARGPNSDRPSYQKTSPSSSATASAHVAINASSSTSSKAIQSANASRASRTSSVDGAAPPNGSEAPQPASGTRVSNAASAATAQPRAQPSSPGAGGTTTFVKAASTLPFRHELSATPPQRTTRSGLREAAFAAKGSATASKSRCAACARTAQHARASSSSRAARQLSLLANARSRLSSAAAAASRIFRAARRSTRRPDSSSSFGQTDPEYKRGRSRSAKTFAAARRARGAHVAWVLEPQPASTCSSGEPQGARPMTLPQAFQSPKTTCETNEYAAPSESNGASNQSA
mmetsp:Transcript_11157/g.34320  ORF Transcript_11157/g.34320 Transcript_11157/m.34320 type:complete len:294 (-) Transcript_11157:1448-2329(-)